MQEENEQVRIFQNRLAEKETEKRHAENQLTFFENQVSNLKSENDKLHIKNTNVENNLNHLLAKSKEQFLAQNLAGETEYMSNKEWNYMNKIKNLESELVSLHKEKDKYYLKYFELLGLKGELEKEDLDESTMDLVNLKYQNNLQLAETKEKQLRRKMSKFFG